MGSTDYDTGDDHHPAVGEDQAWPGLEFLLRRLSGLGQVQDRPRQASAETGDQLRIDGSVNPTSAALGTDGRTVTLQFNTRLSSYAKLDLSVNGKIKDAHGGSVPQASNQAIGPSLVDSTSPTVTSRTWGDSQPSYSVVITFSEAMDAPPLPTFTIHEGGGRPTEAELDSTGGS
jgi:hypothetical protein